MIRNILLTLTLCAALALAACAAPNFPTAPASTATRLPPTNSPTGGIPSATATLATAAPVATDTILPGTPAPEATQVPAAGGGSASAGVITTANATSLVGEPLTLPEYPQRFLWVPSGAALPQQLTPAPALFVWASQALYPITLDPPAVGKRVDLAVPDQVDDFSPDLTSLAASQGGGPAAIYDFSGNVLHQLEGASPVGVSYSSDGKLLAATSLNEFATILYDAATGKRVNRLTGFETAAPVYSAGLVPGNRTLYWISRARMVFQDVQSGQMGKEFSYQDFIGAFAFSPDGARMALSVESRLFLYSVPDGQQLAAIGTSQPLSSLAFSPDGQLLAAGYGPAVQFWDASNLAPVASLAGPNTFTGPVSFSPDGRYLASVHENNIIEIWRVK